MNSNLAGGSIDFTTEGVLFQSVISGTRPVTWPWSDVVHVDFDERRSGTSWLDVGLWGIWGFLIRRHRSTVVVTTRQQEHIIEAGKPLPELRGMARRMVANCPDASGKVSVAGQIVGPPA